VDDAHCFTGFDGYKQVIESSDVVLIANAANFITCRYGHPGGKHVFVEKPHGIDPRGIELMQQVCDLAKEKRLWYCFWAIAALRGLCGDHSENSGMGPSAQS
jgi:hypothetical protein